MQPTKTASEDDLPIDPALQMSTTANPSKLKLLNGDRAELERDGDADDEDEIEPSHDQADDLSKTAWLANREESRKWLNDNYAPIASTPPRYGSAPNYPLSRNGYGNGNDIDGMEMDP